MAKKKKRKFSETAFGKTLLFIVKIPYYIGKGIYSLVRFSGKKIEEKQIEKKRESMIARYVDFKVLATEKGNFQKWSEKMNKSDSKIGVILGARGTGKTAFGIKFLENAHAKDKKKCYAIGFEKTEMPSWIKVVDDIREIPNNSLVLVDEGGILFSSRASMSNANKILSELILISRHKNLSILFISQNSSNLEVNVLRQADFLILKSSSLLQKDFERKIVQKVYDESKEGFEKFKGDKGLTYVYSEEFRGFVSNNLPSFWGEKISKGFKGRWKFP